MNIATNYRWAYGLFILIVGAYLAMAVQFPMAYIFATYEDLVGEWLQFWLFVFALVLFFRLALLKSSLRPFFVLMALCCFYVSMEEVSWGQRLLNLPTPEFFQTHNIQKETNLHNLFTGPVASLTKQCIEYGLAAGLVGYGLLFPLALRAKLRMANIFVKAGIAPPPLFLWPYFVLSGILELGLIRFNEAEIAEMLTAFGLAVIALYYFRSHKIDAGFRRLTQFTGDYPVVLSRGMAAMLAAAVLLAVGSTYQGFTASEQRARIENRLLNGVEKFAGRYKRIGQWETAASLYLEVHQAEPRRSSILRKLADCYSRMGDQGNFERYNGLALQNDLARFENKPGSIAVNQSLARTYRQGGDDKLAAHHLQRALTIAREKVAKDPHSAKAAYWLGRTYKQMGWYGEALGQYETAVRLSPESLKYQKAYLRLKNDPSIKDS